MTPQSHIGSATGVVHIICVML